MRTPQINLLEHGTSPLAETPKPAKFFLSTAILAVIFAASFAFGRFGESKTATAAFAAIEKIPLLGGVGRLMASQDRRLIGEADDRITILLLGMGGENHDGPYLTDTLIVASIQPSTQNIALLSIPRDLIVPLEKYGWRKINAANAFGEQDHPGHGAEATRNVLEGVLGVEIPYYIRVDFNGFAKLVDVLGGVSIDVERPFVDMTYPTEDFGIKTISFRQGPQTMDGRLALQYARSRHGTNGEGNDFARSKRQQKVLAALKEKLKNGATYRNPAKVFGLIGTLKNHVTTNLSFTDIVRLTGLANDFDKPEIFQKVLDNGPASPLIDGSYEDAYVLVPRAGDWHELRDIASGIFAVAEPARTEPQEKPATVTILNGTPANGLAKETSELLTKKGFTVAQVGNAENQTYNVTVAFDATGGNPAALLRLREAMGNIRIVQGAAAKRVGAENPAADFVVILGSDRIK